MGRSVSLAIGSSITQKLPVLSKSCKYVKNKPCLEIENSLYEFSMSAHLLLGLTGNKARISRHF